MSESNSTPSPTSGSRLDEGEKHNDLTDGDLNQDLDLGFEGAEDIRGNRVRDLNKIQPEAYRAVEEIHGVADASAAEIYAGANNINPRAAEFYAFSNQAGIQGHDFRWKHSRSEVTEDKTRLDDPSHRIPVDCFLASSL